MVMDHTRRTRRGYSKEEIRGADASSLLTVCFYLQLKHGCDATCRVRPSNVMNPRLASLGDGATARSFTLEQPSPFCIHQPHKFTFVLSPSHTLLEGATAVF
jgi:hypothetical protein